MASSTPPACGCRHADPLVAFEREALRAVAMSGPPRASGSVSLHPPGLITALDREIVERMEAKASGRPGVNVGRIWSFMTSSVYQSGDLPVLATREALQNGVDAIKAAVRARKTRSGEGRFSVSWDAARRALTWEDNGVGMDAETILTKFLSLGDSGKRDAAGSDEAAGGFGVAKAVILGTSTTFRWEMHTRDNLAVSEGADEDVKVYDAPFLQGTPRGMPARVGMAALVRKVAIRIKGLRRPGLFDGVCVKQGRQPRARNATARRDALRAGRSHAPAALNSRFSAG